MTTHDDYLWDPGQVDPRQVGPRQDGDADAPREADPTVQQLEKLMAVLAHDGRELALPPASSTPGRSMRLWPWLLTVAAAAGIAITTALLWTESNTIAAKLQPGDAVRTFVAANDPVAIPLGDLIEITLDPGSELHFEHWREDSALFRLQRGGLSARVAPPPAIAPDFFLIDTPLGRVTDKGCRYRLSIESNGTNVVRVTEGLVTFSFAQRSVYVPEGASTRVDAGGPSTPLFDDCSAELRRATEQFDAMTEKGEGPMREKGLAALTQACVTKRDSLVLWHLLRDDDELLRELAEEALYDLVGPPEPQFTKGRPHWDPEVWLAFLRIGAWMR